MIPKKTEKSPVTSHGQTKCLYKSIIIIITATMVLVLHLATEINGCVVIPRELLTTAGETVSLECNARPNNEKQGSVSNMKLENESKPETLIFQVPVYNAMGKTSTEQFVASGYFLSNLDENLVNATIQINETQLEHGGLYVCGCTAATISTGSANLVVLSDKLSFASSGGGGGRDGQRTPGAPWDLNCSVSFSGSISSASVDLTINDANGTQLAAKGNLSLTGSGGSRYVNYSFTDHGNKERNFTCEMKVWNRSSSGKRLLRSMTSHYSPNSNSGSDATTASMPASVGPAVAVGVGVGVLVLVTSVVFIVYRKRGKLSSTRNSNSRNFEPQKKSVSVMPRSRYECGKPSIGHPKGSSEDKKQKHQMGTDNEVIVVDNDIYDASSSSDDYKQEQIYQEIR